jgi:uncharacterized cupredoxin-like copper-binding protein
VRFQAHVRISSSRLARSGGRVVSGTFTCTIQKHKATTIAIMGVIVATRPVQEVQVGQSVEKAEAEVKSGDTLRKARNTDPRGQSERAEGEQTRRCGGR